MDSRLIRTLANVLENANYRTIKLNEISEVVENIINELKRNPNKITLKVSLKTKSEDLEFGFNDISNPIFTELLQFKLNEINNTHLQIEQHIKQCLDEAINKDNEWFTDINLEKNVAPKSICDIDLENLKILGFNSEYKAGTNEQIEEILARRPEFKRK